jgi:translation initiation factor IF-1
MMSKSKMMKMYLRDVHAALARVDAMAMAMRVWIREHK